MSACNGKPVKLPSEEYIRARLASLAIEANTLRSLLVVVRRKDRAAKKLPRESTMANVATVK